MYLSKHEIIVIVTLLSYLILGGIVSIIFFIASFIYLQFINKKMRYHIIKNDSQDALMLEGGTSRQKTQLFKIGSILFLWVCVWYFGDANSEMLAEFKKQNIGNQESILQSFIEFWVLLIQLACIILTLNIVYKLFNSSVNSEAYTKREIMLAGSLIIEVISGIYYFYHWLTIGDHSQLLDANMSRIVVHIIIFSVIAASTLSIIIYGKNDEEAKDERDLIIEVKAYKYGFYAITTFISLLIGQLIVDHLALGLWGERALNLNIPMIANLLLFIIILAWTVVSAAQLFFYRRGY